MPLIKNLALPTRHLNKPIPQRYKRLANYHQKITSTVKIREILLWCHTANGINRFACRLNQRVRLFWPCSSSQGQILEAVEHNFCHSDEPYQRICLEENEGADNLCISIPISPCTYQFSCSFPLKHPWTVHPVDWHWKLLGHTMLHSSWFLSHFGWNSATKAMTPEREIAPYEVPRPSLLPWGLEKTTCGSKSWFAPLFFRWKWLVGFKDNLPEVTFIAPENGWSEEDPFLFWEVSTHFQGPCFGEGNEMKTWLFWSNSRPLRSLRLSNKYLPMVLLPDMFRQNHGPHGPSHAAVLARGKFPVRFPCSSLPK